MKSKDEMLDFIGVVLDSVDIPIISSCYKVCKSGAAVIAKEEATKTKQMKKGIHDDLNNFYDSTPHMKENIELALNSMIIKRDWYDI